MIAATPTPLSGVASPDLPATCAARGVLVEAGTAGGRPLSPSGNISLTSACAAPVTGVTTPPVGGECQRPLTVGSLFSGIGGLRQLDLGLERAGMRVVWQSEIDPYASRVLAKHWPHVPNHGDITLIDWSLVEPVDVICGGYPCQPFSLAGVRRGAADPRHLWPYFADAIRHLRPRFALLENVPGHLSMGFGRVLGDLAELGYDAEWDCIPAAAVGAPHLRYRVLVVAYANEHQYEGDTPSFRRATAAQLPADTDGYDLRLQPVGIGRRDGQTVTVDDGEDWSLASDTDDFRRSLGRHFDPRLGQLARHTDWAVEPDVGRVAHGVPHRVDRLKCLGNAVVPQVAEWVGRQIISHVIVRGLPATRPVEAVPVSGSTSSLGPDTGQREAAL